MRFLAVPLQSRLVCKASTAQKTCERSDGKSCIRELVQEAPLAAHVQNSSFILADFQGVRVLSHENQCSLIPPALCGYLSRTVLRGVRAPLPKTLLTHA